MNLARLAVAVPLALVFPLAACGKTSSEEPAVKEAPEHVAPAHTPTPQHAAKPAHAAEAPHAGGVAQHAAAPAEAPQAVVHPVAAHPAAPQPAAPEPAEAQPEPAAAAPVAAAPNAFPPVDEYGRAIDGLPSLIPPPGSPVPTVAEWNAVPKEITVKGSSSYGCETKMLREWLRVSCRTQPEVTPTAVRTTSQAGQQAYVGLFGDRTSCVVQVVHGKEYAAEFTWSAGGERATSTLHVSWPSNQPRPHLYFDP